VADPDAAFRELVELTEEMGLYDPPPRPCCPECGYRVTYDLDCHTWPRRDGNGAERWMACMSCDSAIRYICMRDLDDAGECGWRYTHGLNPRNPRAAANEERRPPWIPAGQELGPALSAWVCPGVPMLGSDDGL
jgi:hypothetical protein